MGRARGASLAPAASSALPVLPCSTSTSLGVKAPSPQHPDMSGHQTPGVLWAGGALPGGGGRVGSLLNAVPLSPGAEDVCGEADAAPAAGFPGLRAGFGCGVWHGGDPLWRGAGGHTAVRLRGQGLLLQ